MMEESGEMRRTTASFLNIYGVLSEHHQIIVLQMIDLEQDCDFFSPLEKASRDTLGYMHG